MKLAILGASGGTGRELVRQALARGHDVSALVRDPAAAGLAPHARLRVVRVDVNEPGSLRMALDRETTVLSGLGNRKGTTRGDRPGVLAAGAQAMLNAGPARTLWLGAFGTGASAQQGGWAVRRLLGWLLAPELPDKVAADNAVLRAGGTVFHAGPLTHGPLSASRRTVGLEAAPRRLFPATISRATVAAAMLDEAETPRFVGAVAVPLAG